MSMIENPNRSKIALYSGRKRIPKPNNDTQFIFPKELTKSQRTEFKRKFFIGLEHVENLLKNPNIKDLVDKTGPIDFRPIYATLSFNLETAARFVPLHDFVIVRKPRLRPELDLLASIFSTNIDQKVDMTTAHEIWHKISVKEISIETGYPKNSYNLIASVFQKILKDYRSVPNEPNNPSLNIFYNLIEINANYFWESCRLVDEAMIDILASSGTPDQGRRESFRSHAGYKYNMALLTLAYFAEQINDIYYQWLNCEDENLKFDKYLVDAIQNSPQIVSFYRDMLEYTLVGEISPENKLINESLINMLAQRAKLKHYDKEDQEDADNDSLNPVDSPDSVVTEFDMERILTFTNFKDEIDAIDLSMFDAIVKLSNSIFLPENLVKLS